MDEGRPTNKLNFAKHPAAWTTSGFESHKHCREYRIPLSLTFVDYEKAFDSVKTNAILSALGDQGVNLAYVRTLADCYKDCITTNPTEKGFDKAIQSRRSCLLRPCTEA
ncbi:unnamed protein product [Cylicostephanus goldi]|uniref:Reverse transcriptase domain-containing protein n=1 Tax=Cylicostephanus goldi TaxID=71465 RepID=A0A3P7MD93_CYLGO|nr:unnamed protein product [Cylicostephanus goldi]